jgi:hypothetical protein
MEDVGVIQRAGSRARRSHMSGVGRGVTVWRGYGIAREDSNKDSQLEGFLFHSQGPSNEGGQWDLREVTRLSDWNYRVRRRRDVLRPDHVTAWPRALAARLGESALVPNSTFSGSDVHGQLARGQFKLVIKLVI